MELNLKISLLLCHSITIMTSLSLSLLLLIVCFSVFLLACPIVDGSYRYSARHQLPIECRLPKKFTYFIKFPRKYPINNVVRCCRIRLPATATATDDYQAQAGAEGKGKAKAVPN